MASLPGLKKLESDFSSLLPVLSQLLERAGTSPIQLEVSLCDSKVVKEYQNRVEELEALLAVSKEDFNRLEFKFRCECIINERLTDFCREQKVNVPPELFRTAGHS